MKRFGLYAVLLFTGLALFGKHSLATNQDNNFWMEAAQGGMAEVMMGNLALQRAQNEEVKRFAQMMVDDHTRSNEELKTLAAGKNVTLPADVNNKQKATMSKLNGRSGADFDREYMKTQVSEHEKMVKLFQRQAERGTDADAKAFAAKTLPNLQSHLEMARTISANVKNMKRGGNSRNNNMNSNSNMNSNNNGNSDMNMNSNRNSNSNRNTNTNSNRNMNSNQNMNSNTNRNTNSNSNRNTNSNGNTNSNRNTNVNSNVNGL